MAENWVVNASPLIVLARAGQVELLSSLADTLVVPRAVAIEIQAGPSGDQARQAITAGKFNIIDAPPAPSELLAWDLGAGETAVLSLAMTEPDWTSILDDAAARRCARSFSLPVKGTLAVVIMAKQADLIPSAVTVMKEIVDGGFRLNDQVIRQALAQTVDEVWP